MKEDVILEARSEAFASGSVLVARMQGREALSQLFELTVDLVSADDGADPLAEHLPELLREPFTLVFRAGRATLHDVRGVLRSVRAMPPRRGGRTTYRAVLVPRFWYLTRHTRSRIFQERSVPAIAHEVLRAIEPHAERFGTLTRDYPTHEYTVQYEESDWAFLCRLLEHEGIALRFEPGEDHDTVVLLDDNRGFRASPELAQVPFHTSPAAASGAPCVTSIDRELRAVAREVTLLDYDWRNPRLELEAKATVAAGVAGTVVTTLDHFRDPDEGARLARVRAEEIAAGAHVVRGTSTLARLRAGDVLGVSGHPDAAFDRAYVVTVVEHEAVQHHGAGDGENVGYRNAFEAIPLEVPFRPARVTPWPRIAGCTYGIVDGPQAGMPAPVDEHGRYKIIFPYDPDPQLGGNASRWVRRAQPLTGPGHGMHLPLREGAEVLVAYVDGDPDRPVIVGGVPNAITPGPVRDLNATQSVISTISGIRITMEDDA